jgi:hypothetical protein
MGKFSAPFLTRPPPPPPLRPTCQDLIHNTQFACSITKEPFRDPVKTLCGHYFEREAVLEHFRNAGTFQCPVCGKDTFGQVNTAFKLVERLKAREAVLAAREGRTVSIESVHLYIYILIYIPIQMTYCTIANDETCAAVFF